MDSIRDKKSCCGCSSLSKRWSNIKAKPKKSWVFVKEEVSHGTGKAYSKFREAWILFNFQENWPTLQALFILITILITYIVICYMLSFDHRHTFDTLGLLVTIYVTDLIYIFDTLYRLVRARKASSKIEVTWKQTILIFFPSLLDVLSLVPIEIIVFLQKTAPPKLKSTDWTIWTYSDAIDGGSGTQVSGLTPGAYNRLWEYHRNLCLSKLNRLIRIYRIAMFYKKKTNELRLNLYTRELFATLVCFFCFLILLFHGIACVWFTLNCKGIVHKNSPPTCDEFGSTLLYNNRTLKSSLQHVPPIYRYTKFEKTDAFGYYVGGLHWSVMSVRNAGNPLFVPENSIQLRISIFVQWLGFIMQCSLLLIALYVATHVDLCRNMFFHEAEGTRSFLDYLEKPTACFSQMHNGLNHVWRTGRGFTDQNLRPLLSSSLQLAIAKSIFKPMLEASEILQTCFTDFELQSIALDVRWKHYLANEIIVRPGCFASTMFYILNGSIDVMHEREDPPQVLLTLDKGSLIGETDAFLPAYRMNGAITRKPCDLLSLSYECTKRIMDESPLTQEKVMDKIKERLNYLKRAKVRHQLLETTQIYRAASVAGPSSEVDKTILPDLEFHEPVRGRKGLDEAAWRQSASAADRLAASQALLDSNLKRLSEVVRPSTSTQNKVDLRLKKAEDDAKFDMYREKPKRIKKTASHKRQKDIQGKPLSENATIQQIPFRKPEIVQKPEHPKQQQPKMLSIEPQVDPSEAECSENELWMAEAESNPGSDSDDPLEADKRMRFMNGFSWLEFFRDPESVRRRSKKASVKVRQETEKFLEGIERYPQSRKIYKLIPTAPLPTVDWKTASVSRKAMIANIWDFLVIAIALGNAYVYPPSIMISDPVFSSPLNLLVDTVYGMDLFFRLFIVFDPEDMYELKRCRHFWNELLKLDILVDLIPVIPVHYLVSAIMKDTINSYRTYLYFRMHVYVVKSIKVMMYFDKLENDVRRNILFVRLLKQINYMAIYIVLISSLFCSYGCDSYPNCLTAADDETWLDFYFNNTLYKTTANHDAYDKKNFGYAFLLSLYWGISTTFGIGLNADFYLLQKRETTLQTVTLFFGFVVIAYYFVNVGATLSGIVENKIHYYDRLIWLRRYLNEERVDKIFVEQMYSYLEIQWDNLRGITMDKSHSGFLAVNHIVYKELLVSMVSHVLNRTYFFQNMDLDTLRRICLAAKVDTVPPDVCLIREGDLVRRIFVIRRGYCEVFRGSTTLNEDMLSSWESFGEANAVHGEISRATVRSVTYCELITIDVDDLQQILETSKCHAFEFEMLRDDPGKFWKLQSHFCVSAAQAYNYPYESEFSAPIPQLQLYWFGCRQDPSAPKTEDIYMNEFIKRCGIFSWIRFFVVPITFFPSGWLIMVWEFVRVYLGVLLIIIFVPPSEAFPEFKATYGRWVYVADFITLFDIWTRCHTAYFQEGTKRLVMHPIWTAKYYAMTGFLLDFYGSLPGYLLIDFACEYLGLDGPEHGWRVFAYILRLNRLIFLIHWYMFRKRQNLKSWSGKNNWRSVRLLVGFLLFHTHIMACATVALGCPTTKKEFDQHGKCYSNTWITNGKVPQLYHKDTAALEGQRIYLFAFYYVATTSVGCGFGDFTPANEVEHVWSILTFFMYILMFTYLLVNAAASRCHYDYKLLQYQQAMNYLVGFLARERINVKLSKRMIQHYDYFWTKKQGIFPDILLRNMYPSLRKEVYVDIYDETFRLVPEFHMTPPSFVRQLCSYMVPIHYMSDEPILEKNDVCEFLYFVVRGDVIVSLSEDEELVVGPGAVIGSMDPRLNDPINEGSARTAHDVDLYFMRREYFMKVLAAYPDISERFEVHGNRDLYMYNLLYANNKTTKTEYYRISKVRKFTHDDNTSSDDEDDNIDSEPTNRRRAKHAKVESSIEIEPPLHRMDEELGKPEGDMVQFKPTMSQIVLDFVRKNKRSLDSKFDMSSLYTSSVLPSAHEFSLFKFIIFIAATISSGISAYQFSFLNFDWVLFGIGLACDAVFYVKIVVSFFLNYYDDQGNLITNPAEIENKYLSEPSGFFLDFFSTFPIDAFVIVYTFLGIEDDPVRKVTTSYYVWVCLRTNRIPRVYIVWQYIQKQYAGMIFNVPRLKLKRLIVFSVVALHWFTCIFHYYTKRYNSDYATGNERFKKKCVCNKDDNYICNNFKYPPEAWFHTKNESTNAFCSPYTMTMYYLTSTFTTTAYGDVYAISVFEMIFIALLALSSKVWFGLLLTDLLSGVQNYIDLTYHLSCDLTLKLYRSYGVPPELLNRVKRFLTFAWSENKGKIIPELLDIAPQCLRIEILYSMYIEHFENCYALRNLSKAFIRHLCTYVHHEWLAEGEYIVHQDQKGQKLYFLHRGVIEATHHEVDKAGKLKNTVTDFITEHHYFGELQALLGPHRYKYTYKAQTHIDLISLCYEDFLEIYERFPLMKELLLTRLCGKYGDDVVEEYRNVKPHFLPGPKPDRARTTLGREINKVEVEY